MLFKAGLVAVCAVLSISSLALASEGAGAGSGGGGEMTSAYYASVVNRALRAAKIVCKGIEGADPQACSWLAPLELAVQTMKVLPRSRDTIVGPDGKARDAGNDGIQTIYLDVDRWNDKLNEADSAKVGDARVAQVRLAFHEPLVLASAETNDSYGISNRFVDLLVSSNFDLGKIVGKPTRSEVTVIERQTFNGDADMNDAGFTWNSCYNGARAEAIAKASSHGFRECSDITKWHTVTYWSQTTVCHVQMECSRPAK